MRNIFLKALALSVIIVGGIFCNGCGDSEGVIQLPENYRRSETALSERVDVDVYFDATVSMKGYTTLAAGNVYRTLPDILSDIGGSMGEIKFYGFGENVTELDGREYRKFSSPEPYNEIITAVHNVIDKADSSHLSIIVTDLFESDSDWTNISKKIRDKFFANHLAVGVIGIRNSFSGEIFDVGLNAAKFQYDSYDYPYRFRPFYLLILGQETAVKNFMLKFKERQTLPNDTGYLLLSENLSEISNDFSKMTLQTPENFYVDEKLSFADKTIKEFGIDSFGKPATLSLNFNYAPPLGACPLNMAEMNSDIKIFALEDEEWEPLSNATAEITLNAVEGEENNFIVQFKVLPEDALKEGRINFIHAELSPSEKGYLMPEWVRNWNMPNVDVDPANFDGSKTINLIHVLGSLKDSVFVASRPALVNLNFVVDAR